MLGRHPDDPNLLDRLHRDRHKLVWGSGKWQTVSGRKLTLNEQAFSSMVRPGQYVLNFTRRDDLWWESLAIHVWGAPFAARKFVEAVIRDDEWCWELMPDGKESRNSLITSSGIRIETNATAFDGCLWEVMHHEYSIAEMGWDLPQPYPRMAMSWRMRDWKAPSPEAAAKRTSVPRASRNGMTTIQDIAAEFEMSPRDARGILRKAKVPKPPQGWAWKPEDAAPIRALMEKHK